MFNKTSSYNLLYIIIRFYFTQIFLRFVVYLFEHDWKIDPFFGLLTQKYFYVKYLTVIKKQYIIIQILIKIHSY